MNTRKYRGFENTNEDIRFLSRLRGHVSSCSEKIDPDQAHRHRVASTSYSIREMNLKYRLYQIHFRNEESSHTVRAAGRDQRRVMVDLIMCERSKMPAQRACLHT